MTFQLTALKWLPEPSHRHGVLLGFVDRLHLPQGDPPKKWQIGPNFAMYGCVAPFEVVWSVDMRCISGMV